MSDEKKHIQHGTVQETLLIPLYARKKCVEKYPDLFHDVDAVRLFDRIDYVMENEPQEFSNLAGGIRQYNFVCEINEYLKDHPRACIVNLGCGLDTTFYQVDNGQTKGYNVDFPDVIAIRNELLPPKGRETNIVGDLTDKSWYEKIDFKEEDGAVFIAGGVFCYLTYDNVKALLCNLADHFHGGAIAFDVVSPFGLQLVKKVVLATAQMQDVDAFFAMKHPERELKKWSDSFASVEAKKYFRGYMKPDKRWDVLTRFVCRIDDYFKICQFVIVHFKYRSLLFTPTLSQQTHNNSISSSRFGSGFSSSFSMITSSTAHERHPHPTFSLLLRRQFVIITFRSLLPLLLRLLLLRRMVATNQVFLHQRRVRYVLQARPVVRVRALHTHLQHLVVRGRLADAAVVTRTPEHARVLLTVYRAQSVLLDAGDVIEARTMMLHALDHRLRHHVSVAVRVDETPAAECVDERLQVVEAEPLLVEGELTLPALADVVALLAALVANHALVGARRAVATLPLRRHALQPHAAQVELLVAAP